MPPATIRCTRCKRLLKLRDTRVSQVTCPHCGHRMVPRKRGGLQKTELHTAPHSKPAQAPSPSVAVPPPQLPKPQAAPDKTLPLGTMGAQAQSTAPKKSRARLRVSNIISEVLDNDKLASSQAPDPQNSLGLLDDLAADEGGESSEPPQRSRSRLAVPADQPDSKRLWGSTSKMDPLVGRELRGLRIERKVGEGGMGSVYEALQLSLERKVALKVLSPRLRGNKSFIKKLETEAKILARVSHPNILHVYDFGEEPSIAIYYMVMEFIDGSDLTELLQRRRRLGQIEALEIIRQAALGLDAAAQNGIIHRDVKPDNIMITKDGICKVSDFGLATDIGVSEGLDKGKKRVGTPAFMSPEQCQGASLDVRSDVYSLGCTAFVALTGQLPFEAESPFEVMLQHRTVPAPSLRAEQSTVSPEVEQIVHRMMAKRPVDRFSSMAELAESLKMVLDNLLQKSTSGEYPAPSSVDTSPTMPGWLTE